MDSVPSRVQVKILGEDYTILGDADESTIRGLASMVDERMRELKQSLPTASNSRLAVLCAMNLADELHQLKNSETGFHPVLEEKTKKLISLLEEGIIGDIYP
jgi:cell division protein ZapA